jgi:mevalonate kinase
MESSGHAFGKVILAGEHAVVYGAPALALGIDRGATARARALARGPSRLRVASWGLQVTDEDTSDLGRALASLLASVRRHQMSPPVDIEAVTDLPAGGGLGCSAALGVAIARAVAGLDRTTDDVREHAMAWERVFHGNPSGVDTTVAVFGGVIRFAREEGRASRVDPVAPRVPLVFAVGHSGTASSTRTMVESVARQRDAKPAVVAESFEGIRRVVTRATHAIEVGNRGLLGEQLDMNQTLLARLSLSTPAIDALCAWAREHGALGAKLTGAGGGGCVVALASGRTGAERILSAWEARSFDGFIAEIEARPTVHTRCGQHGARGNPGEHDGTHVETSRLLQGQRRGAAGAHR